MRQRRLLIASVLAVGVVGCQDTLPTSSTRPVWSLLESVPPRLVGRTPPDYTGVWTGQSKWAGCVAIGPCRSSAVTWPFRMEIAQNGVDVTIRVGDAGQVPGTGYVSSTLGIVATTDHSTYILEPTSEGLSGFFYVDEWSGSKLVRSTRTEISSLKRQPN